MSEARILVLDENRGFGGAERHLLSLARELQEREVLAGVVVRKDSWLYRAGQADLPLLTCGFRNEVDMFSVFSLYKLIKTSRANLLHCVAHRDLVTAALARQLPGCPATVLLKADHSFPDSELSPLFRWAYRQCHAVVSVSTPTQRALQEKLQSEHPWEVHWKVLANGIELGEKRPSLLPQPPFRVGVLSALRPGKGHHDVIEALAHLSPEERGAWHVSFAGEGPLREELETLAAKHQVTIDFVGHLEHPETFLRQLDLCLLPSHVETFSLVALEALTLGVPLLAADSEGVQELFPDSELRYPRGETKLLLERLHDFQRQPQRFLEQAQQLAESYRQQFSRSAMGQRYIDFYRDLLHRSGLGQ